MSRKKTPPSYTDPVGPRIVDAHSYKLSPLGPALQHNGECDLYILIQHTISILINAPLNKASNNATNKMARF